MADERVGSVPAGVEGYSVLMSSLLDYSPTESQEMIPPLFGVSKETNVLDTGPKFRVAESSAIPSFLVTVTDSGIESARLQWCKRPSQMDYDVG